MTRLMGDLVVFMDRGIYRLNIPSTDPTAWSLIESEENIGCQAQHSITTTKDGIYFASQEAIYFLDRNFTIYPITDPIKDEYQSIVRQVTRGTCNLTDYSDKESCETYGGTWTIGSEPDGRLTHTEWDASQERLLCRFGLDTKNIYCYYPQKGLWNTMDVSGHTVYNFYPDEDNVVYTINHNTQTNPDTMLSSMYASSPSESTRLEYKTGWIKVSENSDKAILRRLNMRYTSKDTLTVKVYTDGNESLVVKTITLSPYNEVPQIASIKIGKRAKNFMLEIDSPSTTNNLTIDRLEVEVDE